MEGRIKDAEKVSKRLQVNLYNARKRCKDIDEECQQLSDRSRYLSERVAGLQATLDVGNERDLLLQRIEELESHTFETQEHKKSIWIM